MQRPSSKFIMLLSVGALALSGCITPVQTEGVPAPVSGKPTTGPDGYPTGYPTGSPTGAPINLAMCDTAVKIDANDTATGIAKEDDYLRRNFPGSRKIGQMTVNCGSGKADVITIQLPDGYTREVWFDISSFYGKVGGRDLDDMLDG